MPLSARCPSLPALPTPQLLAVGAAPQTVGPDGHTALHTAAASGSRGSRIVAALMSGGGMDVDARVNSTGATALMMAAKSGAAETIRMLIKAGAMANARANTER